MVDTTIGTTATTANKDGNSNSKAANRGTTPEVTKMNGQTASKAITNTNEKPEYIQRPLTREAHRWLMGFYRADITDLRYKCPAEVWSALIERSMKFKAQVTEDVAKEIVDRAEAKMKLHLVGFNPDLTKAVTPKPVGTKPEQTAIEAAFAAAKATAPVMPQDEVNNLIMSVIDKIIDPTPAIVPNTPTTPTSTTTSPIQPIASVPTVSTKAKKPKVVRAANACFFYGTCPGVGHDKKPSWVIVKNGNRLVAKAVCLEHRNLLAETLGVVFHTRTEVETEIKRRADEKAQFEAALKRESDEARALVVAEKIVDFKSTPAK